MIDLDTVITQISSTTGYDVFPSKDVQPNDQNVSDAPTVFVGYSTIDSKFPNVAYELTRTTMEGEDLVQGFEIQTVCNITDFRSIWINIYKSLVGWNPDEVERQHTTFTYSQGGRMSNSSGSRFWWVDIYKIGFPTSKPLI